MLFLTTIMGAFAAHPTMRSALGGSYWNPGLRLFVEPGIEFDLYEEPGSLLFNDTYLRFVAYTEVTPAYARVGPKIVFSPAAVFEASAHAVVSQYFGTFTAVIGFDEPTATTSPEALQAAAGEGNRGTGWGTRVGADASVRMAYGPAILVGWGKVSHWNMRASDNVPGEYYYEPEFAVMLGQSDTLVDAGGLLVFGGPLDAYVGNITTWWRSDAGEDELWRTGLGLLVLPEGPWSFVAVVQGHLKDRQDRPLFPPYVGAQVMWDL